MSVTTDPTSPAPPPPGTQEGDPREGNPREGDSLGGDSQAGDAREGFSPGGDPLAPFGYRQELRRRMGRYASFAAGFSFISVLTTVFQFFSLGYSFGGPLFFWTWPAVLVGQLLVAACFAELAARLPIAGAIYQWASRLGTPAFGWYAGWIMVIGRIVVVAAAALALQVVLPAVWPGFQLLGGDPSPTTTSGAANAALLGLALLALTTLLNVLDNRALSAVNTIGVTAEIAGVTLIVTLLATHAERDPGITLHTGGQGGLIAALLVGSFTAAYVLIGFESASEMSEETVNPRRTAPRTTLSALTTSGVCGGLLLLGGLLAAPSLTDGRLATEGLSYVLTSTLGDGLGKVLLADVALAVCAATLAIQTSATRMLYSMARDGVLPRSARLAKVPRRTGMPGTAAVVVGVCAGLLLLLNLASPQAFLAIGTTCIAMVYLAYAMVTGPLLVRRLRGEWPPAPTATGDGDRNGNGNGNGNGNDDADRDELGRPLFSLGRWGLPVNALALGYGLLMTVNLSWPRAGVYDPQGGHWYFQWFTVLVLGATVATGAAYRWYRSHRSRRSPGEATPVRV